MRGGVQSFDFENTPSLNLTKVRPMGLDSVSVGPFGASGERVVLEVLAVVVPGVRDFHFVAKGVDSVMTEKRMRRIWKEYHIPPLLSYRILEKGEWAYCARLRKVCVMRLLWPMV